MGGWHFTKWDVWTITKYHLKEMVRWAWETLDAILVSLYDMWISKKGGHGRKSFTYVSDPEPPSLSPLPAPGISGNISITDMMDYLEYPELRPWLPNLLTGWSWASYFSSLGLSLLPFKMEYGTWALMSDQWALAFMSKGSLVRLLKSF